MEKFLSTLQEDASQTINFHHYATEIMEGITFLYNICRFVSNLQTEDVSYDLDNYLRRNDVGLGLIFNIFHYPLTSRYSELTYSYSCDEIVQFLIKNHRRLPGIYRQITTDPLILRMFDYIYLNIEERNPGFKQLLGGFTKTV